MAEPNWFEINKIENLQRDPSNKVEVGNFGDTAVIHGSAVKEIDENLATAY